MISVIMLVYNAEEYLDMSLKPFVDQLSDAFELIVVNDGSKDRSQEILESYAKQCPYIRIVQKENGGVSSARRAGIEVARGEYIWVIDGDDCISEDALEKIEKATRTNPDLITFGIQMKYLEENYVIQRTSEEKLYTNVLEAVEQYFGNDTFNYYWNKVIKKDCMKLEDNPIGLDMAVDFWSNCKMFQRVETVMNLESILYSYMKRKNETMVTRYLRNSEESLCKKEEALLEMMHHFGADTHPLIANYMCREYEVFVINLVSKACPLNKKEKIQLIEAYILNDRAYHCIEQSKPVNQYGEVFKKVALNRSATKLLRTYTTLRVLKDCLGPLYRLARKTIYQNEKRS